MNGHSDQRRKNNEIIKVTKNRNEIGDKVNGRESIQEGDSRQSLDIPGCIRAFQAQVYTGMSVFSCLARCSRSNVFSFTVGSDYTLCAIKKAEPGSMAQLFP